MTAGPGKIERRKREPTSDGKFFEPMVLMIFHSSAGRPEGNRQQHSRPLAHRGNMKAGGEPEDERETTLSSPSISVHHLHRG